MHTFILKNVFMKKHNFVRMFIFVPRKYWSKLCFENCCFQNISICKLEGVRLGASPLVQLLKFENRIGRENRVLGWGAVAVGSGDTGTDSKRGTHVFVYL